jgi:hypothetical protein
MNVSVRILPAKREKKATAINAGMTERSVFDVSGDKRKTAT